MMWLYVDENNNTFSGWVRSYPDKNYKTLGYLKNGQKEGTWLGWHKNGKKKFKQGWEKGNYHGVFNVWYDNGNVQVNGQTKDGEVDGSWKQFYRNGKRNYISENKIGKLITKKYGGAMVKGVTNLKWLMETGHSANMMKMGLTLRL